MRFSGRHSSQLACLLFAPASVTSVGRGFFDGLIVLQNVVSCKPLPEIFCVVQYGYEQITSDHGQAHQGTCRAVVRNHSVSTDLGRARAVRTGCRTDRDQVLSVDSGLHPESRQATTKDVNGRSGSRTRTGLVLLRATQTADLQSAAIPFCHPSEDAGAGQSMASPLRLFFCRVQRRRSAPTDLRLAFQFHNLATMSEKTLIVCSKSGIAPLDDQRRPMLVMARSLERDRSNQNQKVRIIISPTCHWMDDAEPVQPAIRVTGWTNKKGPANCSPSLPNMRKPSEVRRPSSQRPDNPLIRWADFPDRPSKRATRGSGPRPKMGKVLVGLGLSCHVPQQVV